VRELGAVPPVSADAAGLEQVLVNLLLNAIQALTGMPEDAITLALAPDGDERVVLEIRDTGAGMTREVLDRVFDPFFTTKPLGTGMGLGLWVSKGIVDAFGGKLELTSTPGSGTIARLTMRVAAERPLAAAPARPAVALRRHVLVIDDEQRVRDSIAEMLSARHEVVSVADGASALAAVRTRPFDVIVCDVMMAGATGVDVYRQLAADHPGLERRIVFITGGTFTPELGEFIADTGNHVLEKPFPPERLLAAIDTVAAVRS
jgi:CheY-like chemotaxis protein/anti-sigma regulatory factor (Ser/Thr protein kinase)